MSLFKYSTVKKKTCIYIDIREKLISKRISMERLLIFFFNLSSNFPTAVKNIVSRNIRIIISRYKRERGNISNEFAIRSADTRAICSCAKTLLVTETGRPNNYYKNNNDGRRKKML